MRSGDTTDRPEIHIFDYHNITVPRDLCRKSELCLYFRWTPPRVKCAHLLANGVPVPVSIDIREVK